LSATNGERGQGEMCDWAGGSLDLGLRGYVIEQKGMIDSSQRMLGMCDWENGYDREDLSGAGYVMV